MNPSYLGPRFDVSAERGVSVEGLEHLLAEGEIPQGVVEVDLQETLSWCQSSGIFFLLEQVLQS